MGKIIGRLARAAISTDGVTYTDIGEVKTIGLDTSHDLADATTNDSAGWKEEKAADSQVSLEVSGKYDSANAGQVILMAAAFAKTQVYLRFRPQVSSGVEKQVVFLSNISNYKVNTATGDVEEFSCSVRSTGAVTYATQP